MSRPLSRKSLSLTVLLGLAAVIAPPNPVRAGQLTGFTTAPNWAFGVPQRPSIAGCSDTDPGGLSCFGHFGLGPLSDVLDYRNVGQSTIIEISFADSAGPPPAANVFGRRETAFEKANPIDWWNLTIPTARWLGLGVNQGFLYFLRDGGDPVGVFGDEIAYANIGGAAHLLFASNNSDTADATLPDFGATFPAVSFFDVFVDLSPGGSFDQTTLDNSGTPTPMGQECFPGVDAGCVADNPDLTVPTFVPEPSSLAVIASGLAFALFRRRKVQC